MEDEQLYIICIFIIGVFIWYCYNPKKDIIQYSLMVHLDNDKLSEERIKKVKQIYDEYNLPINLMKATHWKHDIDELKMYPITEGTIGNLKRYGAYGLAGSFYKCLKQAYDEGWPYLFFFEDDAVPILPKDKFHTRFNEVMTTLPDNGTGIYILGVAVYCKTRINDKIGWKKINDIKTYISGTHSIYFSKESINRLINYLSNNKIDEPIDEWLKKFNPWVWYGDLSENGMFRGLYKQLGMDCSNVNTLNSPINN